RVGNLCAGAAEASEVPDAVRQAGLVVNHRSVRIEGGEGGACAHEEMGGAVRLVERGEGVGVRNLNCVEHGVAPALLDRPALGELDVERVDRVSGVYRVGLVA